MQKYFVLCNFVYPSKDFYANTSLEILTTLVLNNNCWNYKNKVYNKSTKKILDLSYLINYTIERAKYLKEPKIFVLDDDNNRVNPRLPEISKEDVENFYRKHLY